MPTACGIPGCRSRRSPTKKSAGISFFRIPDVRKFKYSVDINELTQRRRAAWLDVLNTTEWSNSKKINARICSKHFQTGRPAHLEDTSNPDWVPNLDLCPPKKAKKSKPEDRTIHSSNRCTLCVGKINRKEALEVCEADGSFTEFGAIFHYILKLSECPFRSRFCCVKCSKKVVDCFSQVSDLNSVALLATRQTTFNTLTDRLSAGCVQCGEILTDIDDLSDHLRSHLVETYINKVVALDRTADYEDQALKREERKKNGLAIKRRRKIRVQSNESDSSSSLDDPPGNKKQHKEVVLYDEGDSHKLCLTEHCYGEKNNDNLENQAPKPRNKYEIKSDFKGVKWPKSRGIFQKKKIGRPKKIIEIKTEVYESLEYPCKLCDFEFSDESFLKEHIEECHPNGSQPTCEYCQQIVIDTESLNRHILLFHSNDKSKSDKSYKSRIDDDDPGHPCHLCRFRFSNEKVLASHIRLFHDSGKSELAVPLKKRKFVNCDNFDEIDDVIVEYLEDEDAEPATLYACSICAFKLPSKDMLRYHTKSAHKEGKSEQNLPQQSLIILEANKSGEE